MELQSKQRGYGKPTAIVGACLITLGVGAGYFDAATDFRVEFSDLYYAIFLIAAAAGTLFGFVGCLAWARCLGTQHQVTMAMGVFSLPWLMLLLGYPIGGVNIHGPAVPVMLLVIPATILAIIVLIMAVVSRNKVSD